MSQFDRPTEPEDYTRDAFIVYVLMRAFDYSHGSIKDERLEKAFLLFLELLELEGVALDEIFYDNDDQRKLAVTNALSRMNIEGATFTKTRNDGRHYFEPDFFRWAQRVIKNDLPEKMQDACLLVVDKVMSVLVFGDNPERILDEYKLKKMKEQTATL